MTDWAAEREDVLRRFMGELSKATGDGSKKRQAGEKPPWYEDEHMSHVWSHFMKRARGEVIDPDSGAHPYVHAAWRLLAEACKEGGNVPEHEKVVRKIRCLVHPDGCPEWEAKRYQ